MLERDTPAELFERVIHSFRAQHAEAGDSLPVSKLLEVFLGESASIDLDEALRYGITHHLIVRVAGSGYRVALTAEGLKRMSQRKRESAAGE